MPKIHQILCNSLENRVLLENKTHEMADHESCVYNHNHDWVAR